MDEKRHIHPWPYPPQKCKACGRLHQWGDLNSDGICIPCHLELLDEHESVIHDGPLYPLKRYKPEEEG